MYAGLTDRLWQGDRLKTVTLYLNDTVVTGELISLTMTGSVNGDQEQIAVGYTCARTVTIQFASAQSGFSDGLLRIEMQAGEEVLPLGIFRVSESVTKGGQTTVTGVDAMLYLLDRPYISQLHPTRWNRAYGWKVLMEIVSQSGITLGSSVTAFQTYLGTVDMSVMKGEHTCREVVGWMAALCGRNAVISRAGHLEFIWYTASGVTLAQGDCYDGMDQVQEMDSVFSMLSVNVTRADESTVTYVPEGATGTGASMDNNYMSLARLDEIWEEIGGMTYRPADLTFLGDPRLDAGDLISYTLADGTVCNVPVMTVTHTFDGGITTQVVSAGQSETAAAANSSGGALTTKMKQIMAEIAELGSLTVTDENGTTKISGSSIDTTSLFAQNITATGSISGVTLGGEVINISAVNSEMDSTAMIQTAYDTTSYEYTLQLRSEMGNRMGNLFINPSGVTITGTSLNINVDKLTISSACEKNTYTSFHGGVVSDGSVTVVQKGGWCLVHGGIKLTEKVSQMTNVLDTHAVPPPQHKVGIYTTCMYWSGSFHRAMRVGVGADGSLRIQYGGAGTYTFSITYPVE